MKKVMLAGVASGVGKTTITLGLLRSLADRQLQVQAYKVGPDYIDTAYHSRITKKASRNLDSFMIPNDERLRWSFEKWAKDNDIAVVEGVMGLYDGLGTDKDCASSSVVAKKLNIPVVLVLDGKATSTSAAAIVKGFVEFDKDVNIIGAIINRVASQSHYDLIKGAIERYTSVEVLGYIPKNLNVELPSRHLGLIPDVEMEQLDTVFATMGQMVSEHVDIDRLLSLLDAQEDCMSSPFAAPDYSDITLAYALDEAFHFYYQDNLDYLTDMGVTLVPFSPMKDASLPEADAYYFGGGFPEIYAAELEKNSQFRQAVLAAHEAGKPIFAECGGLMYLGERLLIDDNTYNMVGIFEGQSEMTKRLRRFGYCQATTEKDGLFGPAGTQLRGHEFHHSTFNTQEPTVLALEKWRDGERVSQWTGGYQKGNTFASYLHMHFYQDEQLLFNWLDYIREVKQA